MISSNSLCLVMLILTATNRIGSLYGLTCPGPVEEGSTVSLTCSTESTTTALVWQLEVSGQFKEVSRCQVTQDCTNLMAPAFSATLDPSATKNTQYDSVLTISRVSRNQTKFRCLNEICQLEVYVKPAKPQCVGDGAILGHRGLPYRSYLEILCSTASSYPRAKCTLNSTLSSQLVTRALPIYTYTPLGDGNYMTLCTYTMFLGGFQTGHYYFTLIMASDLSTFVPNAATAVEPQFTLTLFAPSLTLGQDCPEGNIKSGMSATCTCKMTHPGYPQGWVKWYTSSNRTTGSTSGDDFTTIALTYNPQNPCPTYECSPESALGRLTPGLSYAPSFEENAGGCPINKVIPTSQENPSDLIIGISVTVGCVLLALILGFLVFICKKKSTEPSTTSPTDVNHFPSSQSISSRDSGFSRKSDFTSITDLSSESRVSPSLPSTGPRVDSLPSALRPIDPVVSRVRPDDDSRAHGAPSVRPGDVNVRPPFDVRMGPYDDIEGPDYNTINSESTARSDIYQGSNPCSTRSVAENFVFDELSHS